MVVLLGILYLVVAWGLAGSQGDCTVVATTETCTGESQAAVAFRDWLEFLF